VSKKNILLFIAIVSLIIAFFAYKEFNRKPADVSSLQVDNTLIADSLISDYESDEVKANKKYLGKVLIVTGNIAEIKKESDTLLNIIVGKVDAMHNVSCLLSNAEQKKVQSYAIGSKVSIKGVCTGFLADVELNRCIIIEGK
jgi:tRNA_anti-like